MSRDKIVPYSATCAQHLSDLMGFSKSTNHSGIKANFNIARTTTKSLDIINQVVLASRPGEFFVQTYRWDIADWPYDINQDQHLIWYTDSGWFLKDLHFKTLGHHLSSLPTSVTDLPFVSLEIVESSP